MAVSKAEFYVCQNCFISTKLREMMDRKLTCDMTFNVGPTFLPRILVRWNCLYEETYSDNGNDLQEWNVFITVSLLGRIHVHSTTISKESVHNHLLWLGIRKKGPVPWHIQNPNSTLQRFCFLWQHVKIRTSKYLLRWKNDANPDISISWRARVQRTSILVGQWWWPVSLYTVSH